jgi:glycosyltransferase involved in cell wall biosynthesis
MNVCLISLVTVWHGVKGGMEVHGQLLAEGLAALGHEVTILSSRRPSGAEATAIGAVTLYALAGARFGSQRHGWASACTRAFSDLHARRPFDVVCCQQAVLPAQVLRLCRRAGIPIVALMEGHEGLMLASEVRESLSHRTGYARLPRQILAFAYHYMKWELPLMRAADRIIAVSDEIARSLRRWFGVSRERIEVVYNGVDTRRFRPDPERRAGTRSALGFRENEAMALYLSHVTRQKGLHVLLHALSRVREAWPRVRVVVVGAGAYLADGQALARRLGVSPHVVFVGEVDHDRAPEYLAACDAFVLPTLRQEGLPFAVLEAMASEKPVLVSRIGGLTSVVQDGVNGLLVRAGDADALAEGLVRLLADRELARRLARAARDTVLRAFSAEHMVRGTADVFERVVKARRAP